MDKFSIINGIISAKLVAVIRGESKESALQTATNCIAGGIKVIEVTFTVPFADEIIKELSLKLKGTGVLLGAGTVLDAETARIAILSGAEFIVSPCLNAETAKLCNRYSVPYIPGIYTASEAQTALECGVDILKLFPGNMEILKSLKPVFPKAKFMVTGGVDKENTADWLNAGASAVGAGAKLTALSAEEIKKWVAIAKK
ncbi:MAG: bifunctional 2-keto-4-hydroxyglutarate aldolase/2-keto-3-deoxy-6-phosphogluconate aldolase [Firmicutes bacterium]|nr:bifunctional 2-keto-4-hydroxyglutarate aldolase/2-keto-3-deoxy-6-phosphogluconate aldolase [Bacillota bacterium]